MDIAAFSKQLDESRRFECVSSTGATFKLQMPTKFAWRLAVERNRDNKGRAIEAMVHRELLEIALVDWTGVKRSLIDDGGGDEVVPFSAAARTLLLEHNTDVMDELAIALGGRLIEQRKSREAAAKN
jgi:hypothetical protein